MNEWTIIRLALTCLPALVVVVILLDLLVEEYLRLMELAGLVRKRSSVPAHDEPDADEDGPDRT